MARLEDVLAVAARPRDPRRPLVCFDERTKEQHREAVAPLPPAPGPPARQASAYERNGVRNLFLVVAPLANWRHVAVTDRRTAVDWAPGMRDLVDGHVPGAERLVVVQDTRNTHTAAALHQAFPPAAAKRLGDRLALQSTPKQGRGLTRAESELRLLSRQCRARRIPDQAPLRPEVAAWAARRNTARATIDGHFTPADARVKLTKVYPTLNLAA